MTEQRWRIVFGTVNAVAAFLLIQPQVQVYPILMIGLGCVVTALGYIQAPGSAPA